MYNCKSNDKPIQMKYRKFKGKKLYEAKDSTILILEILISVRTRYQGTWRSDVFICIYDLFNKVL
jgi:hypothetical protein